MNEISSCPTFLSTLAIFHLHFYYSHPSEGEVVPHCRFNSYFPKGYWCQASFHVLVNHLYILFREICIQVPYPCFHWVTYLLLHCQNSLYILDSRYLSYTWFKNIFSHCGGCIVSMLVMFLIAQVLFFIKFIYFSLICCFGIISKNPLPNPRSWWHVFV